jgi:hypothetical protein
MDSLGGPVHKVSPCQAPGDLGGEARTLPTGNGRFLEPLMPGPLGRADGRGLALARSEGCPKRHPLGARSSVAEWDIHQAQACHNS